MFNKQNDMIDEFKKKLREKHNAPMLILRKKKNNFFMFNAYKQ